MAELALKYDAENASVIEYVQELQKDIELDNLLAPDHPERVKYDKMVEWLKKEGATIEGAKIRYYSDAYRAVHATRDLPSGTRILFVPDHILMSHDRACQTPIGQQLI